MPTRVCASCGRLWFSRIRQRFGERCPECTAAAQAAAGPRPTQGPPGAEAERFLREARRRAAEPGRPLDR